jgi:hypothetical protein
MHIGMQNKVILKKLDGIVEAMETCQRLTGIKPHTCEIIAIYFAQIFP